MGKGPLNPDIMIIGEAPGSQEHYKGEPFIGPSGDLLKQTLSEITKQLGIELTYYFTNTVLCRPPDRQPTDQEIVNCFDRLVKEIEIVQPKKLLVLGGIACKALMGDKFISKVRGRIRYYKDCPIQVTWHPAYILRNPQQFQTLVDDIERLILYNGEEQKIDWAAERSYIFVDDDQKVGEFFKQLSNTDKEPNSLDIETTGLHYFSDFILLVGLRVNGQNYLIPHEIFKKHCWLFPSAIRVIVHNSRFEWQWFKYHYGIELEEIDDTLLMYHILDGRTRGVDKSLKNLGQELLGVHDWDKEIKPYITQMHNAPKELIEKYLCYDVDVTQALYGKLKDLLTADNVWDCYQNIIRPSIPFVNKLTSRGFRVDLDYLEETGDLINEEITGIRREIQQIVGDSNFNPASSQQLSYHLFNKLNLRNVKKNSTDEDTIKTLLAEDEQNSHPILSKILEFRELSKLYSTYFKGLYDKCGPDGRIHAEFLLEGTETGRLSSKNPNLQNIPRDNSVKFSVRKAFLPEEGYQLLDSDYSQLELRVGCHFSQDPELTKFLNGGGDMHREMAAYILNKPIEEIEKKGLERQFAKNMVFAVMFGADVRSLVYTFKKDFPFLTYELAEKSINMLRTKFPELYFQSIRFKDQGINQGFVSTLFGRKRRFPLVTSENREEIMRQACNSPIQGTASDICLLAARRIDKELKEPIVHILVHDSIVSSIPIGYDYEEMLEIMRDVPFESNVKFDVSATVSNRWGGE